MKVEAENNREQTHAEAANEPQAESKSSQRRPVQQQPRMSAALTLIHMKQQQGQPPS